MRTRQIVACGVVLCLLACVMGCDIDPSQIEYSGLPVVDMLRERLAEILARFGG